MTRIVLICAALSLVTACVPAKIATKTVKTGVKATGKVAGAVF